MYKSLMLSGDQVIGGDRGQYEFKQETSN